MSEEDLEAKEERRMSKYFGLSMSGKNNPSLKNKEKDVLKAATSTKSSANNVTPPTSSLARANSYDVDLLNNLVGYSKKKTSEEILNNMANSVPETKVEQKVEQKPEAQIEPKVEQKETKHADLAPSIESTSYPPQKSETIIQDEKTLLANLTRSAHKKSHHFSFPSQEAEITSSQDNTK